MQKDLEKHAQWTSLCVFLAASFRLHENIKVEHGNWQKCTNIVNATAEVAELLNPWQVSCNYYKS